MENGKGSLRNPSSSSSSSSEHLTAVPGQVQQEQPPQHPNKKKNKEIINPTSTTVPTRRDQDCYMPMANVTRIMRRALPPHAKIADDAKETVQQCVSQYINLVTAEANDHCRRDHRRTVSTEDLLWALRRLGFDNYLEPLALFLNRYREARSERDAVSFPAPANFGRPPAVPVVQPPPGQGVFSAHAAVMNGLDFGYPVDNRTGGGSAFSGPSGNGVGPSFDPYAQFR